MQAGQIANAIHSYETDNSGKFPVSSVGANNAMSAASAVQPPNGPDDIMYGGEFKTPSGTTTVAIQGLGYAANNSEVMAVLMDVEYWPAAQGVATINQGHVKNPKRHSFTSLPPRPATPIPPASARMGYIATPGTTPT